MSGSGARPSHRAPRGPGVGIARAAMASVGTVAVVGYALLLNPTTDAQGTSGVGTGASSLENGFEASTATNARSATAPQLRETRQRTHSTTTLLQVRKVGAPQDRTAPAGREWFGIRARTCMNAGARPSGDVPWSVWSVVTSSGTSYAASKAAWTDFPPQQYAPSGLAGGDCNVGWVLVNVPHGSFKDVVKVVFQPHSPDALEWAV